MYIHIYTHTYRRYYMSFSIKMLYQHKHDYQTHISCKDILLYEGTVHVCNRNNLNTHILSHCTSKRQVKGQMTSQKTCHN